MSILHKRNLINNLSKVKGLFFLDKNGFSLVEIVIAIAILSLAVFPFVETVNSNMALVIEAKKKYQALYYAKELLEEIKQKKRGENTTIDTQRYNEMDNIEDYDNYNEKGEGIIILSEDNENFDKNYYRVVNIENADLEKYGEGSRVVNVSCFDSNSIDAAGNNIKLASIDYIYRR